ncbi:MAG: RimK family alpha-L-glutamate ligase [Candidatus Sumerlaeota bacterium]|nr:RimK family alpha-L-glutamate ligase [Candidatus Sumerlaeota bacterium]
MITVILSQNSRLYSTRRLAQAAGERGHKVLVRNPLHFTMTVHTRQPELFFNRRPFEKVDAVIPRIGASITFYGLSVVRQFEMMDIPCLNSSTAFAAQTEDVKAAIHSLGGPPVIVKLLQGAQGVGVMLAESVRSAEAIVDTFQSLNQNILIQEYIASAKGTDLRAIVIGGRVVAAIRRRSTPGDFRSNLHRGGTAERARLAPDYERTAIEAARIIGLRVAGVDMLESDRGPLVIEVNSSPGLEGIEGETKVDIATLMVLEMERVVEQSRLQPFAVPRHLKVADPIPNPD